MSLPDLPEWCRTGDVLEPLEGRKDSGLLDGDRIPAKMLNWLLNRAMAPLVPLMAYAAIQRFGRQEVGADPTSTLFSAVYTIRATGSAWIAASRDTTDGAVASTSTDHGRTWTENVFSAGAIPDSLAVKDGGLAVCIFNRTGGMFASAPAPYTTWTEVTDTSALPPGDDVYVGLVGGTECFCWPSGSNFWYLPTATAPTASADFTQVTSMPTGGGGGGFAYGNGLHLHSDNGAEFRYCEEADAATAGNWTSVATIPGSDASNNSATVFLEKAGLFMVTNAGNEVWTTADCVTWTQATDCPAGDNLRCDQRTGAVYAYVGDSVSDVYVSLDDGASWGLAWAAADHLMYLKGGQEFDLLNQAEGVWLGQNAGAETLRSL